MINLLPPQEKNKLEFARREKLAVILWSVILVPLVCFVLMLLSVSFYVSAEAEYQKGMFKELEQQTANKEIKGVNEAVRSYNINLAKIDSFIENQKYFGNALSLIISAPKPKGVKLVNFSLSEDGAGRIQGSVSGISATRAELLEYKASLEKESRLMDIKFSTASWINARNANFSLKFSLDEK